MTRLLVCAGERHQEGWKSHDVQKFPNTDIVCDFWKLHERVKEGECEEIQFTHALEHFPMEDSVKVLSFLKWLLKPQGMIYIEVPNLYWNAEELVRNPRSRQNVEYIFGGQRNEFDYHYNGYTPEILAEDLRTAGFEILELKPYSSIECTAKNNG